MTGGGSCEIMNYIETDTYRCSLDDWSSRSDPTSVATSVVVAPPTRLPVQTIRRCVFRRMHQPNPHTTLHCLLTNSKCRAYNTGTLSDAQGVARVEISNRFSLTRGAIVSRASSLQLYQHFERTAQRRPADCHFIVIAKEEMLRAGCV